MLTVPTTTRPPITAVIGSQLKIASNSCSNSAGINGTPMPAHYGMQITEPDGTQRPLDENDIWDIVHYVRSISAHAAVDHAGAAGGHADDDHSEEAGH